MQKRSSILKSDSNAVSGVAADSVSTPVAQPVVKNKAAVALGKLGGIKGGPARAAKLSPKKRKAIAKKAALARWSKESSTNAKS